MCGIVGLHGRQEDGWIVAMSGRIRHRGPDGEGSYRDRDVSLALAMRRLSIIDAAGGQQPMAAEDGRYVLVYNGEIYNAPELRRELETEGERFSTDHSDTEVLLRVLIRQGEAGLDRLNGMFAFAFYDRDAGTLLLARDRFGIKPLYYAQVGGRFAFASELKALLALPCLSPELDRQSLFDYMSLMYVPAQASILAGVHRLGPGTLLRYRLADGAVEIHRWWRPSFTPVRKLNARDWAGEICTSLSSSVRRWSLSDFPVACSLSGGLDSSAIVGALAKAGQQPRTFSLGFEGDGEADWNELPRARAVARHWGLEHREIVLKPEQLLDDLVAMVWALDEPYGGGLPSWLVFKAMAREVKVGMTGTGGDELFGSYGKWRQLEGGWLCRRDAAAIDEDRFRREFFGRYYYLADAEKVGSVMVEADRLRSTSDGLYRRFRDAPAEHVRDRVAAVDIDTQLAEEFLLMTDRFSMAHSLEARTPFLDHEFATLALSVPATLRSQRGDAKALLRRAVAPLLPPEARDLPKRGFVVPLKLWLRGPLRPLVERLLDPARLVAQGIFRPGFVERFVRPHLDGRADHTVQVWAAVMFQLWHLVFLERSTPPDFTLADLLDRRLVA